MLWADKMYSIREDSCFLEWKISILYGDHQSTVKILYFLENGAILSVKWGFTIGSRFKRLFRVSGPSTTQTRLENNTNNLPTGIIISRKGQWILVRMVTWGLWNLCVNGNYISKCANNLVLTLTWDTGIAHSILPKPLYTSSQGSPIL